jgi:hypothetical protein
MPEKPPAPAQAVQVQIEIDPATAVGVFVNLAMVNHTDSEFTLDLMYLQPQAPRATVRCRAIMTPKHTKRLLLALQDNISKYEAQFGPIDLGNVPHFPGTPVN